MNSTTSEISIASKGFNLRELANNLAVIDSATSPIVLSRISFATPGRILPLCAMAWAQDKRIVLSNEVLNSDVGRYLQAIEFPRGYSTPREIRRTSYLPITKIEAPFESSSLEVVGKTLREFLLLECGLAARDDLRSALTVGLGELLDNVEQHSRAKSLWLLGQVWRRTRTVEICLVDDGIGIRKSLEDSAKRLKMISTH